MILFSFGLPGRFGEWCETITARLAEAAGGSIARASPTNSEELSIALITSEPLNILISGNQPGAWLRRLLSRTNRRFVLSVNDPATVVWDLMSQYGLDLAASIRQVGSSCASTMPLLTLPGALVLSADRHWREPLETAAAIACHFGLELDRSTIERVVLEATGMGLVPEVPGHPARLDGPDLAIANAALSAYAKYFSGAAFEPITWARELFLADGHRPATGPVDVTGKVRALIYGPYISLPPGNWRAEVALGFSQEATEVNFIVDALIAGFGTQLCVTSIRPPQGGIFSVDLSFTIAEENDNLVEFRVVNERAAFEGQVMLGQISLSLYEPSKSAVELLNAELGL